MRSFASILPSLPRRREPSCERSSFWVPAFAGMIGVVLIGCGDALPEQEFDSTVVQIEPVPDFVPEPIIFEGLPANERAELNLTLQQLYEEKTVATVELSGTFLGMSRVSFERMLDKLDYEQSVKTFGLGAPTVRTNMTCGRGTSRDNFSYLKNAQYNGQPATYVVRAEFTEILVEGKCLRGLKQIPIQKIYEKKI